MRRAVLGVVAAVLSVSPAIAADKMICPGFYMGLGLAAGQGFSYMTKPFTFVCAKPGEEYQFSPGAKGEVALWFTGQGREYMVEVGRKGVGFTLLESIARKDWAEWNKKAVPADLSVDHFAYDTPLGPFEAVVLASPALNEPARKAFFQALRSAGQITVQ